MLSRRIVLSSFLYGLAPALAGFRGEAYAQNSLFQDMEDRFRQLLSRGESLGLSGERTLKSTPSATGSYDQWLIQLVDFSDAADLEAVRERSAKTPLLRQLASDASELIRSLTAEERAPFADLTDEEKQERSVKYSYAMLKDDYLKLFETIQIRQSRAGSVSWHVDKLASPKYREQYEAVSGKLLDSTKAANPPLFEQHGERLRVPWYFIGIIQSLEAGFSFKGHLHNGDPLTARTRQVPAGRPKDWNPPDDWASSAADAMMLKGFHSQPDWSIGAMLFRWEAYNGFGNRRRKVTVNGEVQGVNSPYLWSFSNHYTKGKYVRDGKWDGEKVSSQCGAAVILKGLLDAAIIKPVALG
jgi:lysozyme family protein